MHEPPSEAEHLLQAVELAQSLVAIADQLGEDLAANHISAGLDILKVRAQLCLELNQSIFEQPIPGIGEAEEAPSSVEWIIGPH